MSEKQEEKKDKFDFIPDLASLQDKVNINTTPMSAEDLQVLNQRLAVAYRSVQTKIIDKMREFEEASEKYYWTKRSLLVNIDDKAITVGEWSNTDQTGKIRKMTVDQKNALVMIWLKVMTDNGELPDKHKLENQLERLKTAKYTLSDISSRADAIHNSMSLQLKEEKAGGKSY
jgi:hypothetical protein